MSQEDGHGACRVLGLDVGGANLKAAHRHGIARSLRFALWKNPRGLVQALRDLVGVFQDSDRLALTMTGELCDCYATRREGVVAILDAVQEAADGREVLVWQRNGTFARIAAAREDPLQSAAANWFALAAFAGRFASHESAILIDVGSTTSDLVPLYKGRPIPRGWDDQVRLQFGELVYTGVRRTPICALLGAAGAAEWFATTQDVYLVLGAIPEDARDCDTADGRPASLAGAHARLARMVCADTETTTEEFRLQLAGELRDRQIELLRTALLRVAAHLPGGPSTLLLAGSGEFLAHAVAEQCFPLVPRLSLAERLGPDLSSAACAYAVAVLAEESINAI
jgi:probable H4MPT-linked C1 transfer pathway protein